MSDELFDKKESSRITQPELSHPSCVALQVAIVDLLNSWGIFPSQVIGHSSGEIPAAYAAGKISREAAWKVGYYRGHVSAKVIKKGGMLATGLEKQQIVPYLDDIRGSHSGELTVACFNSPKNITISGDDHLIDILKTALDSDGIFNRKLNVQNAYHSAHMQEVANEYSQLLGTLPEGHMVAQAGHMFSSVTTERV